MSDDGYTQETKTQKFPSSRRKSSKSLNRGSRLYQNGKCDFKKS